MKIVFSWDDGALEDQKLFELHEKYEIPGIFFVPNRNSEGREVITPERIKHAESPMVSFGGHTQNHVYLTDIPIEQVEPEIVNNKEYLEGILEHEIVDFCLPGGKYNEEIIEIARKHYKTIRTADTMNFRSNGELIKPSFHMYNRGKKSLVGNAIRNRSFRELLLVLGMINKDYFSIVENIINRETKKDVTIIIWGHSWELEQYNLWGNVENLFSLVKKENLAVRYADVMGEIQ